MKLFEVPAPAKSFRFTQKTLQENLMCPNLEKIKFLPNRYSVFNLRFSRLGSVMKGVKEINLTFPNLNWKRKER